MFDHILTRLRDDPRDGRRSEVALSDPPSTPAGAGPTDRPAHNLVVLSDAGAERRRRSTAQARLAGNLLYLASVGLVAGATIGAFFGAGFLLLALPTGSSRDPGPQPHSLVYGSLPSSDNEHHPQDSSFRTTAAAGSIPGPAEAAVFSAALPLMPRPSGSEVPANAKKTLADREEPAGSSMPDGREAAGQPAAAPAALIAPTTLGAPPPPLAAPAPAPLNLHLSAAEITQLLGHGDALLKTGDLASARLFYERAAAAGDGRAALRLGATFDPAFLRRAGLGNLKGDAAEARSWYSRALDLRVGGAVDRLNNLETKQGR